ncbi:hypothetical protein BUALT_Bualt03G0136700 [Buddleja alternifolia]|uniref:Uncharacterized protein n=1 Tax=Buddleja alternifolia TaxID=168488 RepID=A0AAV6Y4C4_9LAMI|nr:hypothetical protein BUALT_Bualt03G0136700 [Buddleja alternifolia]
MGGPPIQNSCSVISLQSQKDEEKGSISVASGPDSKPKKKICCACPDTKFFGGSSMTTGAVGARAAGTALALSSSRRSHTCPTWLSYETGKYYWRYVFDNAAMYSTSVAELLFIGGETVQDDVVAAGGNGLGRNLDNGALISILLSCHLHGKLLHFFTDEYVL